MGPPLFNSEWDWNWNNGEKMKKTGLKDRGGLDIYEGEVIMTGMRRDDHAGWTKERVVRMKRPWSQFWKPIEWALENPDTPRDGLMQMQSDEQLRQKLSNI